MIMIFMHELIPFLKAWGVGITISAPLGPVGMLCIRNTLERGLKQALLLGGGAALADTLYSLLAALGLGSVSFFLEKHQRLIQLVGGVILIFFSFYEFQTSPKPLSTDAKPEQSLFGLVQKGFLLTFFNPMTFFGLIALFSTLGLTYTSSTHTLIIPMGVFMGCMTWWMFLATLFQQSKKHIPQSCLSWMRYGSAILLFGCGVISLFGGICKA